MSTSQNASLVLRTADLTAGATNSAGVADTNLTNLTWTNINMRTLLGTMYDQYDEFNLCLSSITTSVAGANVGTSANDRITVINIGGLPFVNNTYNTGLKHNTQSGVIATFTFVQNASAVQYFYSSNVLTFGKNQDVANINITYSRVNLNANGNYLIQTANPFPDVIFVFDIFGVVPSSTRNSSFPNPSFIPSPRG